MSNIKIGDREKDYDEFEKKYGKIIVKKIPVNNPVTTIKYPNKLPFLLDGCNLSEEEAQRQIQQLKNNEKN